MGEILKEFLKAKKNPLQNKDAKSLGVVRVRAIFSFNVVENLILFEDGRDAHCKVQEKIFRLKRLYPGFDFRFIGFAQN
jgi:hypothetical protein